jgi:hypothetical protein
MSDIKAKRIPRESGISAEPAVAHTVEATETAVAQALAAPDLASAVPVHEEERPQAHPMPEPAAPTREEPSREEPSREEPSREPNVEQLASPGAAWSAFGEAQLALVRGMGEIAAEWAGIAQSGIAAGADAAVALLGARTIAEAVEIQAGLASRGFSAVIEGSAKLSEIGVKAASEASRPILSRLAGMSAGFACG